MRQVPWVLLKYKHKNKTSSIYDHFIIWPWSVTLTFNLPEQMFQMAFLLLKENNCAKLFWNPCINVQVMARTSSIYDHFIIWPSNLTLTFHLPEQMFQIALLLLKKNNCAKLNLKSMHKCTSYGPDKLNLWPFYDLTFKCDLHLQPTWANVSNGTATSQEEQLCQFILKSMHICRSYGSDKLNLCDLHVWTWPSTYLKKMFQMALLLLKNNNCGKLFWNPCMNVGVMALENPEAHTYTEQKL